MKKHLTPDAAVFKNTGSAPFKLMETLHPCPPRGQAGMTTATAALGIVGRAHDQWESKPEKQRTLHPWPMREETRETADPPPRQILRTHKNPLEGQ